MKYLNDKYITKKVSKIGIGAGKFGTRISDELAFKMLDMFIEYGGTVIDTARNYYEWVENGRGKSEECIGKWIESRKAREKVCITTKCGVRNEGKIWDINLSRDNLVQELKESLYALRTDYIDIYLLHRDERERPIEEIVETMQYLTEIGNISAIGVANWNVDRVKEANQYAERHGLIPFKVLQTWWSVAEYKKEMWDDETTTHMDRETHQYMLAHNLIGMAYTSQCKGYFQKMALGEADKIDPFLKMRIETERNIQKAAYIKNYCKRNSIHPTAFVNGYITSNELTGIALVSCSTEEQLQNVMDNCNYVLPENIIDDINKI